ncbi:glycosyltransferase [Paraglaciecola sp.]|uniref:glycosyltransferase n=1 Tax=Paraglaciecola sp. TaxID=1920173 RepID=UPI003EF89D86
MSEDMAKSLPKVSVYIPTKNRPTMLKRAIDSVLAQDYKNVEVVVSDDGSTDDTPEFMNKYCKLHNNIIYIRSDTSKGACHARNQAILASTGEFITGLDDDDRFTPERVKVFVKSYRDSDSFLCSLFNNFDGEKYIPSRYYQKTIDKNRIFRRNCVGNQIFVKKQDLLDSNLLFDETFPAWQDYDFFTNLICNLGPARRIFVRTYVMHTDHEKERITNPKRILQGYRLYYKKYRSLMNHSQRVSLAVNAYNLQRKVMPKKLKLLCIKHFNFYDLFKILKSGR